MHDAREHFHSMFFATFCTFPHWNRTGCLKQWKLDKGRERKTILWSANRKFQTPTLIPGLTLIPVLKFEAAKCSSFQAIMPFDDVVAISWRCSFAGSWRDVGYRYVAKADAGESPSSRFVCRRRNSDEQGLESFHLGKCRTSMKLRRSFDAHLDMQGVVAPRKRAASICCKILALLRLPSRLSRWWRNLFALTVGHCWAERPWMIGEVDDRSRSLGE